MPSKKIDNKESPEDIETGLYIQSLKDQAKDKFSDKLFKKLAKVVHYLSDVGLSLKEACIMVGINYDHFEVLMENEPIINQMIKMKELEYKRDLLTTLSKQGRGGDKNIAQWLLELKFPEQFGKKKVGDTDQTEQQIAFDEAIRIVQGAKDSSPIVSPESGRPKPQRDTRTIVEKLEDHLN